MLWFSYPETPASKTVEIPEFVQLLIKTMWTHSGAGILFFSSLLLMGVAQAEAGREEVSMVEDKCRTFVMMIEKYQMKKTGMKTQLYKGYLVIYACQLTYNKHN